MPENQKDEFDFIKEKIKKKPINKRQILLQIIKTTGLAALFGLVACLVFVLVRPIMEDHFYQEDRPLITFPKDTEQIETESENSEAVAVTETDTETEELGQEETEEPTESGTETPIEPRELELADYQLLLNKLYEVGMKANKSIVTVTGVKSDTDWFNTPYEQSGQTSGIIVANTGQELLIMTEKKVIVDVQAIRVTFVNNTMVDATLKKYDGNTGIAILSVPLSEVDENTLSTISVAALGNSFQVRQGDVVIAIGSPLGANFSISPGNITSTSNSISTIDSNFTVFTTDIVGSRRGSGALINLEGQIIGLVMQDYGSEGDENTLTALSISQLKDIIQMLGNNQDVPYLGLGVSTVTGDIETNFELPRGVYIKSVEKDSPAEAASLQNGDVITKIDETEIMTVQQYEQCVRKLAIGQSVDILIQRQGSNGYTEIKCHAEVGTLK